MVFKATNLISEAFDTHGVKYRIVELDDASVVEAAFCVDSGPQVITRFISRDNDNDVAVRIFGLVCKVSDAKRSAVMEACNTLCRKIRFFKFYLDGENSVNVEADLPMNVDDSSVGECCFELFVRIMKILDDEFHILAQALYADPAPRESGQSEILRLLQELRDKPIITDESGDELVPDDSDAFEDPDTLP